MSEGFHLSTIGQIAVTARDLDRATAFYESVLGLPKVLKAPGLAFFDAGGVRLMLSRPEKGEFDHPTSVLYFKVEDIGAAHDALRSRGVDFVEEPHVIAKLPDHDLWLAGFRDSEGNFLALMSEVRPGTASRPV
ncbi:MAG TPA: VOC family protein [Thermoanaerobaculia bacterium]|jgi:methylmalonyl-CoA/ethylmalonyl-CoA epimerase